MGILDRFKKDAQKDVAPTTAQKLSNLEDDSKKAPAAKKKTEAKKTEKKASPSKNAPARAVPKNLEHVVVRPLVSEKAAILAGSNQYAFIVHKKANKIEISQAVKALYGVVPTRVNISNVKGKKIRFGRVQGKRSDWKKAIVTLPEGKTIDVYEGV